MSDACWSSSVQKAIGYEVDDEQKAFENEADSEDTTLGDVSGVVERREHGRGKRDGGI